MTAIPSDKAAKSTGYPVIRLKPSEERRIQSGHLWVFSNELQDGFQDLPPGSVAKILDGWGKFMGIGTVNPHSLITARIFSREPAQLDKEFLRKRIEAATAFRSRLLGEDEAVRLVFGESDGLPGLIVDCFGSALVLQSNTAGMDGLLPTVVEILAEEFSPSAIVAANDASVRELEGLKLSREVVLGSLEGTCEFEQDGLHFFCDALHGQKTGFFLDQRMNRQAMTRYIRKGDRVLDLFCYTGAFGLYALQAGAAHVTFVDASESALSLATETVRRNGFESRAEFIKADVFEFVKDSSEKFDNVFLDPPALAKSRSKVKPALRAYRDLNARAMGLLKTGGILATSSCSGLVSSADWQDALRQASVKAGRSLRLVFQGSQSADHPILAAMPETQYLKSAIGILD